MNSKIFNAYKVQGNVKDLLVRLETNIDENINDSVKLSNVMKNIPGGNLVKLLNTDSSFLPIS